LPIEVSHHFDDVVRLGAWGLALGVLAAPDALTSQRQERVWLWLARRMRRRLDLVIAA
jgi:hypothetical protein